MKHSKLLLGITTVVLAVASIAAAKRLQTPRLRYYCTVHNAGYCTTVLSLCTNGGGPITCFGIVTDGSVQHHTIQVPIYTKGPKGPCDGIHCRTLIHYMGGE